jgi:hypothetical protein
MIDDIFQLDSAIRRTGIPTETLSEISGISRPQISRLLNRRIISKDDTGLLNDTMRRVEQLLAAMRPLALNLSDAEALRATLQLFELGHLNLTVSAGLAALGS